MSEASFADRFVEFYTLRRARSAQEKLGATRVELASLVELGRQRASAAEALFAVGHTAEALRLAVEAAEVTRDAAAKFAAATRAPVRAKVEPKAEAKPDAEPRPDAEASPVAEPDGDAKPDADARPDADAKPDDASDAVKADAEASPVAEASSDAEASPADEAEAPATSWRDAVAPVTSPASLEAADAAFREADALVVPRLEADVTHAHATLFRDLMRARDTVARALGPATQTGAELAFTRVWRPLVTAVLVLGGTLGLWWTVRPVEGTFVRASAIWAESPDFQPTNVIDGNDDSMWLLPNGETGWVEVRFVPARRIAHVELVNAGSARITDRSTADYGLEIWSGGAIAESFSGTFPDELGSRVEHDVNVDAVERIRFLARSTNRVSSGLSELRWE